MDKDPVHPAFAEIGARLKKIIALMGFKSQREFCDHFHFEASTVSMWLKGRSRINIDDAIRICDAAGVTTDYIYRGSMAGLTIERAQKLNEIAA